MKQPGHWTNDELLATLYGVGPAGDHLDVCADCRSRLTAMQQRRASLDAAGAPSICDGFLAAQRRTVYRRLDQRVRWWNSLSVRRWAAGVTTAGVLGGSVLLYEQNQEMKLSQERASDARLMQEVASMANDTGVSSMAPLEGLFE